jgi:8-oxo-dGTP diphosphatase
MSGRRPIAGAGIVVVRDDEILLIQRGKPPFKGEWSIPGGKIEHGETAAETALRELKEETGVEAEIIGLIDVVDSIGARQGEGDWHFLLIDYAARWTAGEPVADGDVADAKFLPLEEAVALTRWDKTRDVVRQAFEMVQAFPSPQSRA